MRLNISPISQAFPTKEQRFKPKNISPRVPTKFSGSLNEIWGGGAVLTVTASLAMDYFTSKANDKRKAGLELVGCWEDRVSSILSLYGIRQKITFLQGQLYIKALEEAHHRTYPKPYIPLSPSSIEQEFMNTLSIQNDRIALDAQLESKMNTASLAFQSLVNHTDTVQTINDLNKTLRNPNITKIPTLLDLMYRQLNTAEYAVFKEIGKEKGLSAIETSRNLNSQDRKKLLAPNPESYSNYIFNPFYYSATVNSMEINQVAAPLQQGYAQPSITRFESQRLMPG